MSARHFTTLLLCLNASLLGLVLLRTTNAAPAADTVRARMLELVDDKGVVRAQINTEDDGEVVFRLRDRRGNLRVKLGAGDGGSGLLLADDQTQIGVHLQSGNSRLTGARATGITVADPTGAKAVLTAKGIK
jgi:hypothetical protein